MGSAGFLGSCGQAAIGAQVRRFALLGWPLMSEPSRIPPGGADVFAMMARVPSQFGQAAAALRRLLVLVSGRSEEGEMAGRSRKPAATVQSFIAALDHPLKQEIAALRQILLEADPGIAEEVKWNAPSFRTSEHFATMRLRPTDSLQLILHLGARSGRTIPEGAIADPHQLLRWLAPDRASVSFAGREDLERKSGPLVAIVREWIKYL